MHFIYSISFRDFKLYASCIPYPSGILNYMLQESLLLGRIYPSGIICFRNLCYFVEYIQGLYASSISYPSGTFNNSYKYAHIQFFCNYQANQNPERNYIYYRSIYFFIINTKFLQETLLHKSYFVLHNFIKFSYKYPFVFKQALHI